MTSKQKYYKCKNCKEETTILTFGDLIDGCSGCGSKKGFLVKEGVKGKYKDYKKESE